MRKYFFIVILALFSCTKVTNNNISVDTKPPYVITGLTDLTLTNGYSTVAYLYLSVNYEDSLQSKVSLSLSALPTGITIDSASWTSSGYPTFSTNLIVYDTTAAGATPGVYPIILTATNSTGYSKAYTFNINVKSVVSCATGLAGAYTHCTSTGTSVTYGDNVTVDSINNRKIWFSNFNNTGLKYYGIVNCATNTISIPYQTAGGNTLYGSGSFTGRYISLTISLNASANYYITMN